MSPLISVFGRSPHLAYEELSALGFEPQKIGTAGAFLGKSPTDPQDAIKLLGGTVKLVEHLGTIPSVEASHLLPYLEKQARGKIDFGISRYDSDQTVPLNVLHVLKDSLDEKGIKSRFVIGKNSPILSNVAITKQDITEFITFPAPDGIGLARTVAIQPYEEWNTRDYGRPHADAKRGMLPPKVSRMVANIALGPDASGKYLYDPFCGMGTVLGEALLRGAHVIGSDIDAPTVTKAQKNLEWLVTEYALRSPGTIQMFPGDAAHAADTVSPMSIDAIVTEPFMGTTKLGEGDPKETDRIKDIVKGLEKMYIGCLKEWYKILKDGGKVVMALPQFTVRGRVYFVKNVIDSCEKLGYTKLLGPIEYSRPQSVVQREFFIFRK